MEPGGATRACAGVLQIQILRRVRQAEGPAKAMPLILGTGGTLASDLEARLREELAPELEVLRLLGSGTHASVFLAREPALKRLIALKALHPTLAADPVMRRRFQREAQSAASIRHPNVTQIFQTRLLADGLPVIMMEYIEGRTLADLLEARGPVPIEEARPMLASLASALAAAHARGIVHRDIRPGNVFIENTTGRAVLADFGIAALVESGSDTATRLTTAGMRLGDVKYMSPEQLRNEPVTAQSDVYSLGMLAFEVLTCHVPFDDRGIAAQIAARLRDAPKPAASLRPEIPADLSDSITRALALDPRHRPRAHDLPAAWGLRPAPGQDAEQGPVSPIASFLNELKRRRVYRVAVFYIVFGAGLVEITDNFGSVFGMGQGGVEILTIVVALGFPAALVLSWLYDITAGGIRRTSGEEGARAGGPAWLPWVGLAASVALEALLVWWVMVIRQ
jgi:serine/threonine-protein kinase